MKRKLTDNVMFSKVYLFPKKCELFSHQWSSISGKKRIAFWKIFRFRHVVLRVKQSVDKDEYGELMKWRRQRKTETLWESVVPVPLFPVQISYGLIWNRTRDWVARNRRLILKKGSDLQLKHPLHNKHFGSLQKTPCSKMCKEITQGCAKFSGVASKS